MIDYKTFLFVSLLLFSLHSCKDPCKKVVCQNGGECIEGICECPPEYTGDNCQVNKCDVLNCQNGSVCVSGTCECPPGYFGESCEQTFQERYLGDWEADQTCISATGQTSESDYTCLITAGGNVLEINLSLGNIGWVTANIESQDSFSIPMQQAIGGQVSGRGAYQNEGRLELDFSITSANGQHECVTVLGR